MVTNPPGCLVIWKFRHRPSGVTHVTIALTAWLAVKAVKLTFQECDSFSWSMQ